MSGKRPILTFVTLALSLLFVVLTPESTFVVLEPAYGLGPSVHPRTTPSGGSPVTGSAPLDPFVLAVIWLAVIAGIGGIVAFFVRFYRRHNEHSTYDDHAPPEIWARGLQNYLRRVGRERDEEESGAKSP